MDYLRTEVLPLLQLTPHEASATNRTARAPRATPNPTSAPGSLRADSDDLPAQTLGHTATGIAQLKHRDRFVLDGWTEVHSRSYSLTDAWRRGDIADVHPPKFTPSRRDPGAGGAPPWSLIRSWCTWRPLIWAAHPQPTSTMADTICWRDRACA